MPADLMAAKEFYEVAIRFGDKSRYKPERDWQQSLRFADFSESDLLREAAWVVLCSGFREHVVRNVFDYISLCFCDWESSATILKMSSACRFSALSAFRNEKKIDALIGIAGVVQQFGFEEFKLRTLREPIDTLQGLPFIGKITAFHLAKNLGLDVAKPDRHLVTLAKRFGYLSVDQLCKDLAGSTGDQVNVVDIALWRFMAEREKRK